MGIQVDGLEYINKENHINIRNKWRRKNKNTTKFIKNKKKKNISYYDFLTEIFNDLKIDSKCRKKLEEPINNAIDDKFNKDLIIKFINANKNFIVNEKIRVFNKWIKFKIYFFQNIELKLRLI